MPIGYTTYYAGSFEDLRSQQALVAAQEEATPEGTLVLLELNLSEAPNPEVLVGLNSRLLSAGVPPWAGYSNVVFANAAQPKVYVAWTKGFAWTPIIIGIIFLILPVILGAVLWFLIPQGVKDMMMMMVGLMMVMIPIMGMVTKEK